MKKRQYGKFASAPSPEAIKKQKQAIVDFYAKKRKQKTRVER